MIAEQLDTLPEELVRQTARGNCVVLVGPTLIDAASRAGFVAALERRSSNQGTTKRSTQEASCVPFQLQDDVFQRHFGPV